MSAEKPIQIESTAKKWKLLQLIGVVIVLAGLGSCMMSLASEQGGAGSAVLFAIGMLFLAVGSFGAWWHHK